MTEPASPLMLQFLEWVASQPRTYDQAMDAWRTSCPRLSIWEDALIGGLISVNTVPPTQRVEVTLTERGRAIVDASRVR